MFILVNYPAEYGIGDGISEIGRYDTREDAEKFCEYARKQCKGCTFKPVHA